MGYVVPLKGYRIDYSTRKYHTDLLSRFKQEKVFKCTLTYEKVLQGSHCISKKRRFADVNLVLHWIFSTKY